MESGVDRLEIELEEYGLEFKESTGEIADGLGGVGLGDEAEHNGVDIRLEKGWVVLFEEDEIIPVAMARNGIPCWRAKFRNETFEGIE